MGIDAHALHCLDYAKLFGDFGRTATLGRQNLYIKPAVLEARYGSRLDWKKQVYCEGLLETAFGASKVDSIDRSDYEGASIVFDMNQPLPDGFGEYDTVMDIGTTEHVFNVPQALKNMIALCREGGQILHVSPANNFCGHGFWQFSPELFFSLYSEENGFRDTEVFIGSRKKTDVWYKVKKPNPGERVPLGSRDKIYAICRTVRSGRVDARALDVQQSDYIVRWEEGVPPAERPNPDADRSWLNRRILHKYFRTPSRFNPNLTRVQLPYRPQIQGR
jgi:hypothetical protein